MQNKTYKDLFLELAKPDENGISRLVSVDEFVGEYAVLITRNGGSWFRSSSSLAKKFIILTEKKGNRTIAIKLDGYRKDVVGSESVRADIIREIKKKRCLIIGTSLPEPDHKNGRKDDLRVMNTKTQTIDDFQPLSTAANSAKRQICKECRQTGFRYDARNLGYPVAVVEGKYEKPLGCVGCFWYDPIAFRDKLEFKTK